MEEREMKVVPPTAEVATALHRWATQQADNLTPEELAVNLASSEVWTELAKLHSFPAWEDGFDAGEEDAMSHETWDEECIPNPWDKDTPYTPPPAT